MLTAACVPPGVTTVVEKGVSEARGGRGDLQEVTPLPAGNVLDRFRSVRVLPVQSSPDSGPIPNTLPGVLETTLVNGIREAQLFPGRGTPTLFVRVRVTTYWQDEGLLQVLRAYSEILARVEFLEERRPTPLGAYYVRGFSTAIKRKSDADLSAGLTSSVVEIIKQHRSASLKDK
ncbi:MAG TPA: hypothetical protein VMS64_40405 [Candidatus Methylomirabilis sp.]|nr:hypothetical protein [Candidatus Methylomirabilis sp.]